MRRVIVAFLLSGTMAGSAFGQSDGFNRTVQLGGAYIVMNQSYLSGGATENDVISGPGVQLVGTSGNPFGFLIAASFAWAQGATENGASVSLSPYDRRFIDDILLGFAYRQTLIPHLGVTLGAGAHALGAQIFSSASIGAYLDVAYVAGIEGVARVSYDFTKSVGLYLSATASYDPLALVDATTRSYQSGITYSAGAGIEILR